MNINENIIKWLKTSHENNDTNQLDEWINNRLEQELGGYVDQKVEEVQGTGDLSIDKISDRIANMIVDSPRMQEFKNSLLSNTRTSVGELSKTEYIQEVSDIDDSWEPNLNDICSMVSRHQPPGMRIQGLKALLRLPLGEVVRSSNWYQLQRGLCEALCDENRSVFLTVMKFHTKMLSSSSLEPIKEGFLCLLEGLTIHYLSHHIYLSLPNRMHGLQLSVPSHYRAVQIMNAAIQALAEMSKSWIRYGERRVEEVIDNFVDLLAMHTYNRRISGKEQGREILYPFHILSVVDAEAKWFHNLMHAAFSRNILFKSLIKSISLLIRIVEEVSSWLDCEISKSNSVFIVYEAYSSGNISGNMVSLATFIHSLSILTIIVNFEKGCALFPMQLHSQENPVTIYRTAISILTVLNKQGDQPHSPHFCKILENSIVTMILSRSGRILSGSCTEFTNLLLEPGKQGRPDLHDHCISILSSLSEVDIAVSWMLRRNNRRIKGSVSRNLTSSASSSSSRINTSPSPVCPGICIAKAVAECTAFRLFRATNLMHSLEAVNSAIQLLNVCSKIFSACDGFLILEKSQYKLIESSVKLFYYLTNEAYNDELSLSLVRSVENFLIGLTNTPLGFQAVAERNGVVKKLICSYIDRPWILWDIPRIRQLLQLSAVLIDENCDLSSERNKLLNSMLLKLWNTMNDGASLLSGSDRIWREELNKYLSCLLTICASTDVVAEMLNEKEVSGEVDARSDDNTLIDEELEEPHSLLELLSGAIRDTNSPFEYYIGLLTVHALSHNLNTILLLQEKFNIQEHLTKHQSEVGVRIPFESLGLSGDLQTSPRKESTIVRDESSVLRSHILLIIQQIQDFGQEGVHMFRSLNTSPQMQPRTSRSRMQSDLQRFLQDTRLGLHDSMWLTHARRAYRSSSQCEIKINVLLDLLEQISRSQAPVQTQFSWPTTQIVPELINTRHLMAIQMIVRYGCQLKILLPGSTSQNCEQLTVLLYQSQAFLGQLEDNSFDWFVASVFLICAGNVERCRCLLQRISQLPAGSLLWPSLSRALLGSDVQQQFRAKAHLGHHLQSLISTHLPLAQQALQEAGISWWQIMDELGKQAFLPALHFSQLAHILVLGALHPWEYLVYFRVALLAHLQPQLLSAVMKGNVHSLISEFSFEQFRMCDYLTFLDRLAKLNRVTGARDRTFMHTL